jgi:hypothetical protein
MRHRQLIGRAKMEVRVEFQSRSRIPDDMQPHRRSKAGAAHITCPIVLLDPRDNPHRGMSFDQSMEQTRQRLDDA